MRIGNSSYDRATDVPDVVPVFPLSGALLLPRAHLPLNIFEPRYLQMIDDALAGARVIGMVQPRFDRDADGGVPELCGVGALGRIVSFQETGDGRYLIQLCGISRFDVVEEIAAEVPYRRCRISVGRFERDMSVAKGADAVDRAALIKAFESYLEANDLEADWGSVRGASNESLVNTLAMMSPYGPAEKQALLEAPDLAARAATLVAITEIELARRSGDEKPLH